MILTPMDYWKLRVLVKEQQLAELQAQITLERAKMAFENRVQFMTSLGLDPNKNHRFNDVTFEATDLNPAEEG